MIKANFSLIKQQAADAVRYARNKDDRAVKSLTAFYEQGKNAPGYANLMLLDQLNANTQRTTDLFESGDINLKESLKVDAAPFVILKITKEIIPDKYKEFKKAYMEMYPKTSSKRQAIENYLAAYDVTSKTPAKNKKGFKKFWTLFFNIKNKFTS